MSNKENLLEVISRFENTPMLVIGDLILDHYIWGKVSRISPEAPVVVVKATKETRGLGGAANVASNLRQLKSQVKVSGIVGEDEFASLLLSQLREIGAGTEGIIPDSTRPTTSKSRVVAHAQQVVRVDREDASPCSEHVQSKIKSYLADQIDGSSAIIISDYAKGVVTESLFEPLLKAKEQGRIGLGKKPVIIDPKFPNYNFYHGTTVIKPNRSEAEDASGVIIDSVDAAKKAAKILLKKWNCELILITLGEDGMLFVSENEAEQIPTRAREVYDVSGAGDTVSAVFALSLAVGATPLQAAMLSNIAAGIVVAEVGTVPIRFSQLEQAIKDIKD